MKIFSLKQAVSVSIVLYVGCFILVVGIGFNNVGGAAFTANNTTASGGGAVRKVVVAPPPSVTKSPTPASSPVAANPTPTATPQPTANPTPTSRPTPTPTPTPKPTPTPPPPPPAAPPCGSGGPCTAVEVSNHDTQSDCWVIYSNKVYNITAFIPNHPGPTNVFNSKTCGQDIAPYLNGSKSATSGGRTHTHSSDAYNMLMTYYVADLK